MKHSPQTFPFRLVFLCDFDPFQAWLRGSRGRKEPLPGVGQPPLPQFRLLGILLLEKGKGKAVLLEVASLGAPASSGREQGACHKADPGRSHSPSASSLLRRCSPSASLLSWPLFGGILGGVFFLGSRACSRTQARRHTGPRPPSSVYCSRLPAGRALAAGLAMPRLAAQSAALREPHTKAASPGLEPLGFRSSVLSPHPSPKKFWGLFHRVGDPWPSRQVGQRPKTLSTPWETG